MNYVRSSLSTLTVLVATTAAAIAIELDSDRPGHDYRNFEIAESNPGPCAAACARESQCRAWTYVKPGIQGTRGRCWLKTAVPEAYTNRCCISGVTGEDPGTEEAREVQSILATLGYDPGPVDGKPGPQTRDAIRRFQSEHQMTPDGRVSPLLVKGLWGVAHNRDLNAAPPAAVADRPSMPAPAPPPAAKAPLPPAVPAEDLSDLSTLD